MSLSGGDTRIVGGDDGVGLGQEPPGLRGMAKNGDDGLRGAGGSACRGRRGMGGLGVKRARLTAGEASSSEERLCRLVSLLLLRHGSMRGVCR